MKYGSTDIMLESKKDRHSYMGSIKEEESSEWSDASGMSSWEHKRVNMFHTATLLVWFELIFCIRQRNCKHSSRHVHAKC